MEVEVEKIAHLRSEAPPHKLYDHLIEVGKKAEENANSFLGASWAKLLGIWHDLGKYNPDWQNYIRKASGNPEDAHLETDNKKRGPNHSSAGGLYALRWLRQHQQFKDYPEEIINSLACLIAYPIMGHHAGLADYDGGEGSLNNRLFNPDKDHLALAKEGNPPNDILSPDISDFDLEALKDGRDFSVFIRMLFSCLVDADFLDTEAYMLPGRERGKYPALEILRQEMETHMKLFGNDSSNVNTARAHVLTACLEKAGEAPGFFSLTVPTGGGKTLSSLAFALEHAKQHGKRRIIYAIPYTSIIEQTAEVFRNVFKNCGDTVIEHHSNMSDADSADETSMQRLASENWDAPLIVTTTVQIFESLYAARTSRCRKLHNIAGSVIILDEAHLMPPELRKPILHSLDQLVKFYGVTVVLCTATPVGLEKMKSEGKYIQYMNHVITAPDELYEKLERVNVTIRPETVEDWSKLAGELEQYQQVLCIVGRRDDCRDLHAVMPEGTIHLSALMCAEHRSRVIADIKKRLKEQRPIRVISTQLVEAGVDVDFPVVYRAMAGLDSIAQAAGRCNREGKLAGLGKVVVFRPKREAPKGTLKWAQQAAEAVLRQNPGSKVLSPQMQEKYFHDFYSRCENGDKPGILSSLLKHNYEMRYQFRSAAEAFRIIKDDYRSIIVRYDNDKLLSKLLQGKPDRQLLRKLQRYTVNVPQQLLEHFLKEKAVKEILPGLYVQNTDNLYDNSLGLAKEYSNEWVPADLVT